MIPQSQMYRDALQLTEMYRHALKYKYDLNRKNRSDFNCILKQNCIWRAKLKLTALTR